MLMFFCSVNDCGAETHLLCVIKLKQISDCSLFYANTSKCTETTSTFQLTIKMLLSSFEDTYILNVFFVKL